MTNSEETDVMPGEELEYAWCFRKMNPQASGHYIWIPSFSKPPGYIKTDITPEKAREYKCWLKDAVCRPEEMHEKDRECFNGISKLLSAAATKER